MKTGMQPEDRAASSPASGWSAVRPADAQSNELPREVPWLDQLKGKAPILLGVVAAWVVVMVLVGWFAVRPRLTHTTVTGNVVMTYFVAQAQIDQMANDIPGMDPSLLIPKCEGNGFRVNIRDGSGRILASPVGTQVETSRTGDESVYTLVCTTVFTASVPKTDVYQFSTVLGESNPENPDYQATVTRQRSELEAGNGPVLSMKEVVPGLP